MGSEDQGAGGGVQAVPEAEDPGHHAARAGDRAVQCVLREDGSLHEAEGAGSGGWIHVENLRPGDVRGHQVWGELHAPEAQGRRVGEAAHEEGLGQARDAHEHRVSAGEQRDEQLLDHPALSDDPALELGDEVVVRTLNPLEEFERCGVVGAGGVGVVGHGVVGVARVDRLRSCCPRT